MDAERIRRALARIEAAAERIGRSASSAPADSELAGKYAALREQTGAALADLDRVIGGLER